MGGLNFAHIIYFNVFTHSLPYGIYIRDSGSPQRGDYAATCLTPQIAQYGIEKHYLAEGNCDTGIVFVLKIIKGIPGDFFSVSDGFLRLNGNAYTVMRKDSSGKPLAVFCNQKKGIIQKGNYILLSNFVKNSWDSRYWGPVGIQFLLKPLWIFEHVKS